MFAEKHDALITLQKLVGLHNLYPQIYVKIHPKIKSGLRKLKASEEVLDFVDYVSFSGYLAPNTLQILAVILDLNKAIKQNAVR
jgi:hypothetical protein